MIESVIGGSAYLNVGSYSGSTYVNGYSGAQGVGNIRYNTSTQKIEIFDGNNWITMNHGSATVSLSNEAIDILNWAKIKMAEDKELERLAKEHPSVKDLVDGINKKKDQIKMIQNLVKKESEWANEAGQVQTGP